MHSEAEVYVQRPYAPPHLFRPNACYFITGKTLGGATLMSTAARREQLLASLRFACDRWGWKLSAWVVLSNHYHCLLVAPEAAGELSRLLASVHRFTATAWNKEDGTPGRPVWYRYWDTCIDHESSLWARVNYIHYNPVRHGLADEPARYPFSSYSEWAEETDLQALEGAYPWDRLALEL